MRLRRRGRWSLAAAGALCGTIVGAAFAHAQQSPQPGTAEDLTAQLALRVAAAIAPAVELRLETPGGAGLQRQLAMRLEDRGVRTVAGNAPVPVVRAACADNLRERACSAEIELPPADARSATRYVIVVTGPHDPVARRGEAILTLQARPLVTSNAPILDVARAGARLLMLTPSALVVNEQADGTWRAVASRPISAPRAWPRDLRGRLRVAGARVEAFLPGVHCSGNLSESAWSCSEGSGAWPMAIDGAHLAPGRNYFTVSVGPAFYGIANVRGEAGASWAVATLDRRLAFVRDGGQIAQTTVVADDIVALKAACMGEPHVLITAHGESQGDAATLYRVADRQAEAAAMTLALPGKVTALWPSFEEESALVVTHDAAAGRYEAQQISVRCDR